MHSLQYRDVLSDMLKGSNKAASKQMNKYMRGLESRKGNVAAMLTSDTA